MEQNYVQWGLNENASINGVHEKYWMTSKCGHNVRVYKLSQLWNAIEKFKQYTLLATDGEPQRRANILYELKFFFF